jgi:hypothetical protein
MDTDGALIKKRGGGYMVTKGCRLLVLLVLTSCLCISVPIVPASGASNSSDGATLELKEQNSLGQVPTGGAAGTLEYSLTGPKFSYKFFASGLDKNTNYTLIRSLEPDVALPARYEIIDEGLSNDSGTLTFVGHHNFTMYKLETGEKAKEKFNTSLLAAKIILCPSDQLPDKPLTYQGKYLFGYGTIRFTDTTTRLIAGANQTIFAPQSNGSWDDPLRGPRVGQDAIDFILYGIQQDTLTEDEEEQPLKKFSLHDLLKEKPVLLVNGAFT